MQGYTVPQLYEGVTYYIRQFIDYINLKAFVTSVPAAYAAHFFGDWHLFELYFFAALGDLFFGLVVSFKRCNFVWERVGAWVIKLLAHCLTIIVVGIVSHVVYVVSKYDVPILNVFMFLLILMELSSVLRNASKCGLPVPPIVLTLLAKANKKAKDKLTNIVDEGVK